MATDTPFMKFWSALNEECDNRKLQHLTYGPAKLAFNDVLRICRKQTEAAILKVA